MDLWLPDSFRDNRKNTDAKNRDLFRQLDGEHLTTAEILYALPDYPLLLQTYIWQDYDRAPRFPALQKFINFWQRDIEGKLHQVTVSVRETFGAAKFTIYADEFDLG